MPKLRQYVKHHRFVVLIITAMALLVLFASAGGAGAGVGATQVPSPNNWDPIGEDLGVGSGSVVRFSSPTLADLNGDSALDVIIGTNNGYLVAVNGLDGEVLWSRNVMSYGVNQAGCNTNIIRSAPAVGMLRAPGDPSATLAVAVGIGDSPFTKSTGGVIAFAANGDFLWKFLTTDQHQGPDGCADGVVASPTVTDVDKDGRDEVMFGSFDTLFYVLRDDGTKYPNWPQDYLDSHWSSPAVGDLDGDGQNEIIVASDEGQQAIPCPYALDWAHNYCGGSVYAMRLDGSWLPGFPYYVWQAIQSQPALADLDQDGYLDIIVGTGTYYQADAASSNFDTFKLFAIDKDGNDLPGWPVNLQGPTDGEPAVADIDGDGKMEVVMGTSQQYCFQGTCPGLKTAPNGGGWLFAYNHDGSLLWQKQPQATDGGQTGPIRTPMIADYDNDGTLEVIYSIQWEVQIVDGPTGNYEIGGPGATLKMLTNWTILGAPAIGDINNDGQVEIVAASALSGGAAGAVYAWRPSGVSAGSVELPWPMFRRTASHTGRYSPPAISGGPDSLARFHASGNGPIYTHIFAVKNTGDETMTFMASANHADVSVQPSSGTPVAAGATTYMTVTLDLNGYNTNGTFALGQVTMTATYAGGVSAVNSPDSFNVTVFVVDQVYTSYLPTLRKNSTP